MKRTVKVGIVGLGARAEVLLASFLQMDEMEVIAVCDYQERLIQKILGIFEKYGKPAPQTFTDYHKMLELEELELDELELEELDDELDELEELELDELELLPGPEHIP